MSNLALFMKRNKVGRENVKYAPTKSLLGEDGKPLEFELKPLTTSENEHIREQCMAEVPIKGKPHAYRPKLNTSAYMAKMVAASVVVPDLLNAELQDSYGVKTPEDLIKEMVDDPGEYSDMLAFVQKTNGFDVSMDELVEEAKN